MRTADGELVGAEVDDVVIAGVRWEQLGQQQRRSSEKLPAAMVLLSDGKTTIGRDPVDVAREAGRAHVPIFAIALGTAAGEVELRDSFGFLQRVSVPPDIAGLKQIAALSGGKEFTATEADKLQQIYAGLGTRLSSREVKEEVTVAFAGGALLLLVAGLVTSLLRTGRLP